jgi:hypothetical protein
MRVHFHIPRHFMLPSVYHTLVYVMQAPNSLQTVSQNKRGQACIRQATGPGSRSHARRGDSGQRKAAAPDGPQKAIEQQTMLDYLDCQLQPHKSTDEGLSLGTAEFTSTPSYQQEITRTHLTVLGLCSSGVVTLGLLGRTWSHLVLFDLLL